MSWKTYDTEGVRKLESSLDELATALDGDWTTGDRFDINRYREARERGVGEPAFGKQVRSGHWKDSGVAKAVVAEGRLLTDNLGRKGVVQVAVLGLTARDLENLKTIAESHHLKNYGAVIRNVLSRSAGAI